MKLQTRTIKFVVPAIPPSINNTYIPVNRGGGRYGTKVMSQEAKRFKELTAIYARQAMAGHKIIDGPFSMSVDYYMVNDKHNRERDVTNCEKALIDAMKGIVFVDDRTMGRNVFGSHFDDLGIIFGVHFAKFIVPKNPLTQVQVTYYQPTQSNGE